MLVKQVFKDIYSEDPLQARAPLLDQFAKKCGKLQIQMKIFEESFLDCFDIVLQQLQVSVFQNERFHLIC